MTDEFSIACCYECKRPLTAIDYDGEHLTACMSCNLWGPPGKGSRWKRLPEEDLRALHLMMRGSGE
jgi:hypothetical protein